MKLEIKTIDDPIELGVRILNLRVRYPALAWMRLSELVDGESNISPIVVKHATRERVNLFDMECKCLYHEEGTYHSNPECPFFID